MGSSEAEGEGGRPEGARMRFGETFGGKVGKRRRAFKERVDRAREDEASCHEDVEYKKRSQYDSVS